MLRRFIAGLLVVFSVLGMAFASAELTQNPVLETAFTMLEEGNIFVQRYNEITGSDVQPYFASGLPYFFGGKEISLVMKNYPNFYAKKCLETTTYYRKGKLYIYGFDCSGYINWVRETNQLSTFDSLNTLFKQGAYGKYFMWNDHQDLAKPMPEDLTLIKDEAQVGDVLVIHARGNHILMYIGTLRDYGFTAEEVPALADYLDYPLMIHCGVNPLYGERIQKIIDENAGGNLGHVLTTNGGVQVSIWGVPRDKAEEHRIDNAGKKAETIHDWFLLSDGKTTMTIYDFHNVTKWRWLRVNEPLAQTKKKK